MSSALRWLLSLSVLLPASRVAAQMPLTVNLADVGTDTARISPGRYQVHIVNKIPTARYRISVNIDLLPIPPIDKTTITAQSPGKEKCGGIRSAVAALRAVDKERDVPDRVGAFTDSVRSSKEATTCRAVIDSGSALVARTEQIDPAVWVVEKGEYVTVHVIRESSQKLGGAEFKKTFSTGAAGEWLTTYGFAFPWNADLGFGAGTRANEGRHVEAVDSNQFVVRPDDARAVDAVPSVFYHFSRGWSYRGWGNVAPVAGFGLDLTNPSVFLALGKSYWQNLLVSAGVAARYESVPKSRYAIGDTVKEELDEDQLTRKDIRVRPFVSVTLRFSGNPFGKSKTDEQKPADKEAGSGTESDSGKKESQQSDEDSTGSAQDQTGVARAVSPVDSGSYAVIVGIARYPDPAENLPGPRSDAEGMRSVLVNRFGVPDSHILMLLDEEATRDAIISGIRSQLGKASAKGNAILFYAGHGALLDKNYSIQDKEDSGVDQALYVWGTGNTPTIILDDELGVLFRDLTSRRAVVIIDACFSGTGITLMAAGNEPKPKTRSVTVESGSGAIPSKFISDGAPLPTTGAGFNEVENAVLLAATRDTMFSWGASNWPSPGEGHGIFTYFLTQKLTTEPQTATAETLIKDIDAALNKDRICTKYKACENPQVGGGRRKETLASIFRPPAPGKP